MSFRAHGHVDGKRIRRNFSTRVEAESFALVENQATIEKITAQKTAPRRFTSTVLTAEELAAVEAAKQKLGDRITIPALLALGESSLAHSPKSGKVGDLIEEWLGVVDGRLGERWQADLRARLRRFAADNPALTTANLTQPTIRRWLDGLDLSQVSKGHYRSCLSRWCGWLVQTGHISANPCSGLVVDKPTSGVARNSAMPAILAAPQARALLTALDNPRRHKVLGWVVLCLFCGLRPEAEAQHLQWAEVDLEAGRLQVYGRKRGASVRIIEMQPAALAWLRYVRSKDASPVLSGPDLRLSKKEQAEKARRLSLLVGRPSRRALLWAITAANAVLEKQGLALIKWEGDIMRHTYASMRAPTAAIHDLAREMGTSAEMLHRHYRHPVTAEAAAGFWQIMPSA